MPHHEACNHTQTIAKSVRYIQMIMFLLSAGLTYTPNAPCYKSFDRPADVWRFIYVQSGATWLSEIVALLVGWMWADKKFKINTPRLYAQWLSEHPRVFVGQMAIGCHVLMDLYLAMVSQNFDIER